jgi:ribosome maturation factor RimP
VVLDRAERPFFVPVSFDAAGCSGCLSMSQKLQHIEALLSPLIGDLGLELLGVEYSPSSHRSMLRLYIEAPDRLVTVDDCALVSREVSALLDVNDPIEGQYVLEVSSPGFDRPLFSAAHFSRFLGEKAKIALHLPIEGRRRFTAEIVAVDDSAVLVRQDGADYRLALDNIQKARLVPDYARIGFGQGVEAGADESETDVELSIYEDVKPPRGRRPSGL